MKAGALVEQDFEDETCERPVKKSNSLPVWGNEKTMNLNPLILTNIQSSQYFKVNLYQLKTYHEVIDEIYYQVNHLEPWEKGSRKTSGQTGMCGGVRGVGAGGIVSTAFCILYKLYTLKLTRKQVLGLINHSDSPYIRGLGLMYIRFTQPPADLWEWFEPYLDDEEEIDVRAGGGQTSTIGAVVRHMLTKLEWHSTLFPRIPVPIQKDIEKKLSERVPPKPHASESYSTGREYGEKEKRKEEPNGEYRYKDRYEKDDRDKREKERDEKHRDREHRSREKDGREHRSRDRDGRDFRSKERDSREHKSRDRDGKEHRSKDGDSREYRSGDRDAREHKSRDRDAREHKSRDRDYRDKQREDRHHNRERSRDRDKNRDKEKRSDDRDRHHHHHHQHSSRSHHRDHRERRSFSYEIEREKERIKREKKKSRSRSRSRERNRRHRDY